MKLTRKKLFIFGGNKRVNQLFGNAFIRNEHALFGSVFRQQTSVPRI